MCGWASNQAKHFSFRFGKHLDGPLREATVSNLLATLLATVVRDLLQKVSSILNI